MKTLCIYHGNCADGFGAAWAVRKALGAENVDFHAGVYQSPPPDVTDRDVIMVDFSYKRDVVAEMAEKARRVLILDHHKSAFEDLGDAFLNADGAGFNYDRYNRFHTAGVMVVTKDDGRGAKEAVAHEVVGNVLVGAEEAEAALEALLARKRELLGEA